MADAWIEDVNRFWFEELTPQDWFNPPPAVDEKIRARFVSLFENLKAQPPDSASLDVQGHVAAVIVFDQFPRNMFRHSADAFATDRIALGLARDAVDRGMDANLGPHQRQFLYMPFMHSENRTDQARALELFEKLGLEEPLRSAKMHKDIIDRFGRFPFRNEPLGRPSSDAEREFMRTHKAF